MIPDELKELLKSFFVNNKEVVFLVVLLIIIAYLALIWLPCDNPIEEAVEVVIEKETGIEVDLTPKFLSRFPTYLM